MTVSGIALESSKGCACGRSYTVVLNGFLSGPRLLIPLLGSRISRSETGRGVKLERRRFRAMRRSALCPKNPQGLHCILSPTILTAVFACFAFVVIWLTWSFTTINPKFSGRFGRPRRHCSNLSNLRQDSNLFAHATAAQARRRDSEDSNLDGFDQLHQETIPQSLSNRAITTNGNNKPIAGFNELRFFSRVCRSCALRARRAFLATLRG